VTNTLSMRFFFISVCLFFSLQSQAQNFQWAFRIGGSTDDVGKRIFADNNGFVYVSGYFKGSNIDFDPGSGTALLSSIGDKDGFVAKYTVGGQYIWAFRIGGGGLDEAAATVDLSGDVYVTGYFRGNNVDFDPGPGTALLSRNGDSGGDPGYGGDIFIAKYNSNGQYQWAFNIGGSLLGDNGTVLATDNSGNIYVGGYFRETPDFDPGPGTAILNSAAGTIFLAKYNSSGQYQWAFNLGEGNVDNAPFGLTVDAAANVYLTGFFQGTGRDFDPSPTTSAFLNSGGSYDVFVAKYNTNGQYQWAFPIGGAGVDVGRDVEVDNLGNVYVAGDFEGSSIDFNPSSGAALLSANNRDVFLAKYNSSGQYQWAKRFGAGGSDISWSLGFTNNNVYITGSYQGTINFDPAGTDNLTSNGANDFYITKFDMNGNYICAFSAGGSGNDEGYRIDADNAGNLYVTGMLSSSNVDFNPSSAVTNALSSAGSSDVFFAKYTWPDNIMPSGTLSGNTITCNGQGQLIFTASSGTGPFTIEYSNGSTVYTQTNVQSGVPFNLIPNPIATTTYALVSVRGSERCPAVNYPTGITGTVTISLGLDFNYTQTSCTPKTVQFNNLTPNTTSISWDFGNATTNTGSQSPTVTYAAFGNYPVKLRVQTSSGCIDSITKIIPVIVQQDSLITRADTTICKGSTVQLNTLPALDFCWGTAPGLSSTTSSNPVASPDVTTTYYFTSQSTGNNLVANGDFSAGNSGFQSDYVSNFPNTAAAQYWVGTSPSAWWSTFPNCGDHTTGSANMMMVNGSQTIGAKVWYQIVTVTPNTNYAFATWVKSLDPVSPANLRFSINNTVLGNNILASATTCVWNRFYVTWNSGNSTTATILIANNNTAFSGNDFALDDISFSQVFLKQDSVKITVADPPAVNAGNDATICAGQSIQLNATGGSVYSWSPISGLSDPNIANPVATPAATTQYIVTGYNLPGCVNKDTVVVTVSAGIAPDFSYSQNTCNPKTIQFSNLSSGVTSIEWDFGNSTTNTGSTSPLLSYANYGTYVVKMKVQSSSVCIDSVVKSIPVMMQQDSLIALADTTLCKGNSAQLTTLPALEFCWGTAPGLNNITIPNPVATPTATTTYYFTSQAAGSNNLVINGNFSAGNTGFQSGYTYNFPNTAETQYWVGSNPASWYVTFPACGDHSTGTGNMMMVNGASATGTKVWYQTINVTPNTNYVFSAWVQSVDPRSPADLRFSINNNLLGSLLAAPVNCQWRQFFITWNSGNKTTVTLAIINNNTALAGNDFALDDISFAQVFLKQDSVNIAVADPPIVNAGNDTSFCDGQSVLLNATGASVYSWSPATGLSNVNTANPLATPSSTTQYILTAYDLPGCVAKDSVMVTVKPKPVITKTNDTTLCTGGSPVSISATSPGAIQYSWTPSTGLSNAGVSNPSANPSATTNYHIEITGNNGCKSTDSINVTVFPVPTVDTRSDTTLCSGTQLTLNTVTTGASSYTWSPVTGLSNPNIANPVAIPAGLTKYILTVSNGACSAKDSVTLNVIPSPTITTSNDTTICDQGQAQLLAAGGNNYLWYPSAGLSNVNIANPVATPAAATKYYVSVTGANGCKKTDSVMVNWVAKPVFSITPPTVSICTGDSTLLSATGADTYNWFSGSGIQSPSASSTMVNPAVTQQYRVAVHHNFCRLNDTLQSTVTVNNLPLVAVSKSNDIDCSNASATLSASGGVTYNWMPAVNISAGNTANPVVSPPLSTTYVVKVTNNNGCSKYDSIRVIVAFNPITGGYNVPDAFTPNHDNKNDCFGIKYWGVVQAFELSIFNRWGEMVFHSTNPSACWDGSYQGAPQATGTFVYQIRAKTACGDVFKKGTLALIR
jgi:gliding motility-associated-like protein